MEFTAKVIAELVHGRVEGDASATVSTFAQIDQGQKGALSFLANAKYTHYIYTTPSSVVLVNEDIVLAQRVTTTIIRVKDAYASMAQLMQIYQTLVPQKEGIDPLAYIAPTAQLGEGCYVGAFAYVGEGTIVGKGCLIHPHAVIGDRVTVGNGCCLYPHVVVYHDCILGNRVTLHAGSVIGADGFGFTPTADGYEKIPQIGTVTIDDDVEIGANACIDRATMGTTHIHRGVKLDNLVQIAHNTDIGEHTVMSAQVGIAGSTTVGAWCTFAGQVGIADHLTIGDHVMLGAKSGVPSNIASHQALMGLPPVPQVTYYKMRILMQQLPQMSKHIQALQQQIDALKASLAAEAKEE